MHSCIYAGSVRHRPFAPVANDFRYRIFMLYLDLAELDQVFDGYWFWSAKRPAPAWFRRADHAGVTDQPLDAYIRDLVARETGRRPDGAIRLLTHLRYFGYCFNPVSFYYCYGADGAVRDVVMEVNNTPWGETHCYVVPRHADSGPAMRFDFDKAFHVSPFLPMDMRYRSRVTMMAHVFRPRVLLYTAILAAITVALGVALYVRTPLKVNIMRDRTTLVRETDEGLLENVYRMQIINMDEKPHRYKLTATGLEGLKVVTAEAQPLEVNAAESHNISISLRVDPNDVKPGSTQVHIQVQDVDNPAFSVNEKTSFIVK